MTQPTEPLQSSSTSSGPARSYELNQLVSGVETMQREVDAIGKAWTQDFLRKAVAPTGDNFDAYAKPIIVMAESLRRQNMREMARHVYDVAIRMTDAHCKAVGVDLHRGALYANFGIAHLEHNDYEIGISWLLAAANEDVRFKRVPKITDSYALSPEGIYGQWVDSTVFKRIPPDAFLFTENRCGMKIGLIEFLKMLHALAGNGDLNLLRGVVEYESVRGRSDYMSHSVRFSCLRDLATLFEVLLKRIGEHHNDPRVRTAFGDSPMLANIIHYMHYPKMRKRGIRGMLKRLFKRKRSYTDGLFWNSIRQDTDVLEAIKKGFNRVKNFRTPTNDVWKYLTTSTLLDAARADNEQVAKRLLLSYRVRNQTSHSFKPEDPGIVAHADEMHLWLLQSILYIYFWFTRTGQVTL